MNKITWNTPQGLEAAPKLKLSKIVEASNVGDMLPRAVLDNIGRKVVEDRKSACRERVFPPV